MNCPTCSIDNRPGAMFCDRCGSPMAIPLVCVECKTENRSSAKFCDNCGSSLQMLTDVYPLDAFTRTSRTLRPKRKTGRTLSTKALIFGGLLVAFLASILLSSLLGPGFIMKIVNPAVSLFSPTQVQAPRDDAGLIK